MLIWLIILLNFGCSLPYPYENEYIVNNPVYSYNTKYIDEYYDLYLGEQYCLTNCSICNTEVFIDNMKVYSDSTTYDYKFVASGRELKIRYHNKNNKSVNFIIGYK